MIDREEIKKVLFDEYETLPEHIKQCASYVGVVDQSAQLTVSARNAALISLIVNHRVSEAFDELISRLEKALGTKLENK